MSVFEFRKMIESAIPLWVPLSFIVLSLLALFLIQTFGKKS
jgi:hypothetical protein